jgi:hypothetical protein
MYNARYARAFFKVEENNVAFKTHYATRAVVNFYSADVVTQDRRIGSIAASHQSTDLQL